MATKGQKAKGKKQKVLKAKLQLISSIFLIIFGVVLIGFAASKNFDFGTEQPKNRTTQEPVSFKPEYNKISRISIPKIKRDLAVSDGKFEDGRWQVASEGVSFYTQSALPGAGGNTVLYGHNKARILGGLVDVRAGDKIELTLQNGKALTYQVDQTKTIRPSEVEILNQTEEPRLTIYTCAGFLDSARFVVIAYPVAN